jgi:TRAP-type uncharacterized transport system substrate-binding protein
MWNHALLKGIIRKWQQQTGTRRLLGGAVLLALSVLLVLAARSVNGMIPRNYAMTISGGEITSNRHFLAKALQETAASNDVALELRPTDGSQQALALVAAGKLDFAFIQGGLDQPYPSVVHVATIAPELMHFLVRPGIRDIAGLRGKRVNFNSKKGGTRLVARQILKFAGLREGIDYVESNISTEQLLTLRTERLPEGIVVTSFAPSEIVDHIVRQHGYTLLEVPFSSSFALRHGWAASSEIAAFMYSVEPPVPARDLKTIGVNLRLVANRRVDPRAVSKVLESLFSPRLETRLKMHLDETNILASASYPPSDATRSFMDRKRPLFSHAMLNEVKAGIGLLVTLCSAALVIFKWIKEAPGKSDPPDMGDQALIGYLGQVADLDTALGTHLARGVLDGQTVRELDLELSAIKAAALGLLGKSAFDDQHLPHTLLLAIAHLRGRLDSQRLAQLGVR